MDPRPSLHDIGTPESWRQAGALLARAHASPLLRRLESTWSSSSLAGFAADLAQLVDRRMVAPQHAERALRLAEDLRPVLEAAPIVWLHGDCQPDHFLVDEHSMDVVALIDWADAQPGDPVMDLAVLLMFSERADEVLDGYGASRDLRDRTSLLLPLYQAMRGAGSALWLQRHGYTGVAWPLEALSRFAAT